MAMVRKRGILAEEVARMMMPTQAGPPQLCPLAASSMANKLISENADSTNKQPCHTAGYGALHNDQTIGIFGYLCGSSSAYVHL